MRCLAFFLKKTRLSRKLFLLHVAKDLHTLKSMKSLSCYPIIKTLIFPSWISYSEVQFLPSHIGFIIIGIFLKLISSRNWMTIFDNDFVQLLLYPILKFQTVYDKECWSMRSWKKNWISGINLRFNSIVNYFTVLKASSSTKNKTNKIHLKKVFGRRGVPAYDNTVVAPCKCTHLWVLLIQENYFK